MAIWHTKLRTISNSKGKPIRQSTANIRMALATVVTCALTRSGI